MHIKTEEKAIENIKAIVNAKSGDCVRVLPAVQMKYGLSEYVRIVRYGEHPCNPVDPLSVLIEL